MPSSSSNARRRQATSPLRNRPVSISTHRARSPKARDASAAATIDGAPPDTAAITSPSGQDARSVVTQSSRNAGIVHSPFRPHTPSAKFFSICMPSGSLLSTPNCAANAVPASFCAAAAKPPSPSADT